MWITEAVLHTPREKPAGFPQHAQALLVAVLSKLVTEYAHDLVRCGGQGPFTVRLAVEFGKAKGRSEAHADGARLDVGVPARPGLVSTRDGARDDRDASLQRKAERAEAWVLKAAIPGSFPFDVDRDGVAMLEAAEHETDGLRIDLVAADRERVKSLHDRADEGG